MKNVLLGLLVITLIAGGVGGTWYYMDMQLKAANEQITFAQGETASAKNQVITLGAEIKAKADAEAAEQALLANLEAFMLLTGSGKSIEALDALYDSTVLVEGEIPAPSLRTYSLALQKYWKGMSAAEGVKATPIKVSNGEWTAVVSLVEKNVTAPLTLSQSGTLLKAPARTQQQLVMTLAKWKDGKIVEQYDFPYAGDVSKSNLLKYVSVSASGSVDTPTGTGTSTQGAPKMTEDKTSTSQTQAPAQKMAPSTPKTVETGTGTEKPNEA